ncbi:NAD(P)-dependent oxidoreductase [Streptomyces sp. NPDC050161]|uniref:NAD(P)-dependent oxidoreductase n=1 Tax=Streptomyces sp. NPDC050161 TaxID=3365604 RepID=UPI0037934A88
MSEIAFIGLGVMGAPMAANLVGAGHRVTGVDPVPAARQRLVDTGGAAAERIGDAVRNADAVITMLPDSPVVEEVWLGADGVLAHARPGTLLIDMSTIAPQASRKVARAARAAGLRPLDAPVSGGEPGAVAGTLSIMTGGEPADFAAAEPLLTALGSVVSHLGPDGAGQLVKATNQLLHGGIIALVSEAIVLLEAAGVDGTKGLRVLANGWGANRILDQKAASMLARDFTPGFRIDLHHKDMGILGQAARELGVSLPMTGLVTQLIAAARAQGLGALDHTSLLTVVEGLNRPQGSGRKAAVTP